MSDTEGLTCAPLDSIEEMYNLLENPPPWRSLCIDLKPHSEFAIRNTTILQNNQEIHFDCTVDFCHFKPETEKKPELTERKKLPKAMVCHDYANGYHDDKFVDGSANAEAYTFYCWAGVDVFCYFSHHFITIPPLAWINAAHMHGVKVIGTLITEHGEGAELCNRFLSSKTEGQKFASGLVALAKVCRFDGWLINIENKVSQPLELLKFVKYFHRVLHAELKDPVLIWYDSVTQDGQLIWQNALNDRNRVFFEACDGILTNYSWNEQNVKDSATNADVRLTDVYIGIDVWGRNFIGGGRFNTQEAVKIAHKHGCSLGIFAPAWTHEDIDGAAGTSTRYSQFCLRERALWDSLWPLLSTRLPSALPFCTSFCRGQGRKMMRYGEIVSPNPWYNLRNMHYQLNSNHGCHGYLLATLEHIYKLSCHTPKDDEYNSLPVREIYHHIKGNKCIDILMLDENSIKEKSESSSNLVEITDKRVASLGESLKVPDDGAKNKIVLLEVPKEKACLEVHYADGFNGGSCLQVNPSDETSPLHRTIRLLYCDFLINHALVVCVVTKRLKEGPHQRLNIILHCLSNEEKSIQILLRGDVGLVKSSGFVPGDNVVEVDPIVKESHHHFTNLQKYLLNKCPDFYVPTENTHGWKVRYYRVEMAGHRVMSISCRTQNPITPILLGHLGLCDMTN